MKEAGVTFVYLDEVGSSKLELATEICRGKCLVPHKFVTKMKEKLREMTLKRMAVDKEVCVLHVGYRYSPNSC
jgi:hypothetical protein